jgi:putative transferase (TIGR04331 family)
MQSKFLILHKNDFKYSKNINKIVPFYSYILEDININYSELLDFKISKKELFKIINYLDLLYEKILEILYQNLNNLNNTNYSRRYWGIIIGPWLISYLQIMIRNWLIVKRISKKKTNIIFNYYYYQKKNPLKNLTDFVAFVNTPEFNCTIKSELIKNFFSQKNFICLKKIKVSPKKLNNATQLSYKINTKFKIIKLIFLLLSFKRVMRKIVIINTGIGLIKEIFIYFRKLTIPYFFLDLQVIDKRLARFSNTLDKKKRLKLISNLNPKNTLEKFIFHKIYNYFPLSYLENFKKYYFEEKKIFPVNAKNILSATNHYTYDILKFWIARQIENNSKLYSIQHGANPGYSIFVSNQYHDNKHADRLITWGWTGNEKTFKGCFSLKKSKIIKNNKKILLVFYTNTLFQSNIKPNLYFCENNFYYQFYFNLIKNLSETFDENLVIRLPRFSILADYCRKQLLNLNKKIKFDTNDNFLDSLKDSKLVITSWEATIFLQSLNANVPTIAYWDQSNCVVTDDALKYFIALQKHNVLCSDYKKISQFVIKNYNNLGNWWGSKSTASSVINFRNNFCKEGDINQKLLECID